MPTWSSRMALSAAVWVLLGCTVLSAQVLKGSKVAAYSPQWGGFRMETLHHDLKLTPQQQSQINPILESEQNQFAEIRETTAQKILPVLNPDQRKRFGDANSPQWGGHPAGGSVFAYSPQWGGFMLQHLARELKLNKEQQAKIGPILTQAQNEFQSAHQQAGGHVASVLHPDQQRKFQTTSRKME